MDSRGVFAQVLLLWHHWGVTVAVKDLPRGVGSSLGLLNGTEQRFVYKGAFTLFRSYTHIALCHLTI